MRKGTLTRREALEYAARVFGQQLDGKAPGPSVPLGELVNSLEFAEQAKLVLSEEDFSSIAGSDRSIFDQYTFRPRMNVSTLDMDLSVDLFGHTLFTPVVVGPVSNQKRYHPEGERATIAGASAAKAVTIVSSHASTPIPEMAAIAAEAAMPLWTAVYADEEGRRARKPPRPLGPKPSSSPSGLPTRTRTPNEAPRLIGASSRRFGSRSMCRWFSRASCRKPMRRRRLSSLWTVSSYPTSVAC